MSITIRHKTQEDEFAVLRLAQLDDRPVPQGDLLLAFVDGELAAARPIEMKSAAVADPFRRTKEILEMLDLRAKQELKADVRTFARRRRLLAV